MSLQLGEKIRIEERDLEWRFVRASGPGGQNVNKVATAVQLRFDLERAEGLPDEVRARLRRLAGRRMTADGVLVIEAHRTRSQQQNKDDALERLKSLIERAAIPPKPRRPTKPTRGSKERRLQSKSRRGTIKKMRGTLDREG